MKPKILKLGTIVLLLLFAGAGCQKDVINYDDESITVSNNPGVFVYKTKDSYMDKVWVQITPEGELNQILALDRKDTNIEIDKDDNVIPLYRHLLKSGYVVGDAHKWAAYTDITFKEYLSYNEKNGTGSWPEELIWPRIIDRNPYVELYWWGCLNCKTEKYTLGEINTMIENGTLETVFTKLK